MEQVAKLKRSWNSAPVLQIIQKILKIIALAYIFQLAKFSDLMSCMFFFCFCFSIRVSFHRHWRLTGQQRKGGDHFLFHSTTVTRSQTFRHLFATLHVWWLSHIFNRNACIYQTATRWYFTILSNYHLIDW